MHESHRIIELFHRISDARPNSPEIYSVCDQRKLFRVMHQTVRSCSYQSAYEIHVSLFFLIDKSARVALYFVASFNTNRRTSLPKLPHKIGQIVLV